MSDYEKIRLRNLEDNRRILASFGLSDPFKSLPKIIKKGRKSVYKSVDSKTEPRPSVPDSHFVGASLYIPRLRSARLKEFIGSEVSSEELEDADHDIKRVPKVQSNRPKFYGEVAGVEVGTIWSTRLECCRDGIHRPTVAGIHGGENGAFSIALSGGYEDDVDLGDCFTYTGEGGRDLKGTRSNPKNLRTAPQSKDQTLTRGNLALSINVETKNPVRVIRGYKLDSPFAPEEGYRYDGLYTVEKCWFTTGMSGFGVWKFALKRCTAQIPPPWQFSLDSSLSLKSNSCSMSNGHEITPKSAEIIPNSADQLLTNAAIDNLQNCESIKENNVNNVAVAGGKPKRGLDNQSCLHAGDKDSKKVLREIAAGCSSAPARKRVCRK